MRSVGSAKFATYTSLVPVASDEYDASLPSGEARTSFSSDGVSSHTRGVAPGRGATAHRSGRNDGLLREKRISFPSGVTSDTCSIVPFIGVVIVAPPAAARRRK